jgi:hypothetical protein
MISEQARENGATCAREDEAQSVADLQNASSSVKVQQPAVQALQFVPSSHMPSLRGKGTHKVPPRDKSVIRLPSF